MKLTFDPLQPLQFVGVLGWEERAVRIRTVGRAEIGGLSGAAATAAAGTRRARGGTEEQQRGGTWSPFTGSSEEGRGGRRARGWADGGTPRQELCYNDPSNSTATCTALTVFDRRESFFLFVLLLLFPNSSYSCSFSSARATIGRALKM